MSGCLGTTKAGLLDIHVNGHKKVSTNGGSVEGCLLQENNALTGDWFLLQEANALERTSYRGTY